MRLKTYINELSLADLQKDIDEKCSEIQNIYEKTDMRLYRGIRGSVKNPIIPNKKRKPVDSSIQLHDFTNIGFQAVFGKKLRSESVFCTGSRYASGTFGATYIIYPSNGFEVYWSPYIPDFYSGLPLDVSIPNLDVMMFFLIYSLISIQDEDNVQSRLEYKFDQYKGTRDIFLSNITPEQVKLFDTEELTNKDISKITNNLIKRHPEASKAFVKFFYRKGNIEEAMKSKNEMMITCNLYYAVEG